MNSRFFSAHIDTSNIKYWLDLILKLFKLYRIVHRRHGYIDILQKLIVNFEIYIVLKRIQAFVICPAFKLSLIIL